MFFKKEIVEGYCLDCGEVRQGFKVFFRLELYILTIFLVYMGLSICISSQREIFNNLFLIGLVIGIGYKNSCMGEKKRCIICNRELID